jgi:hypothetical protein
VMMMRFVLMDVLTLAALISIGGICGFVWFWDLIAKDKENCRQMIEDGCTWHTWVNHVCQACGKRAGVNPQERG